MNYVVVGYVLIYGVLIGYAALLMVRLRAAEKKAGDQP